MGNGINTLFLVRAVSRGLVMPLLNQGTRSADSDDQRLEAAPDPGTPSTLGAGRGISHGTVRATEARNQHPTMKVNWNFLASKHSAFETA